MSRVTLEYRLLQCIGDGHNFSDIQLFLEMGIQGAITVGDIIRLQENTLHVLDVEEVSDEDYLETYTILIAQILTNDPNEKVHLNLIDSRKSIRMAMLCYRSHEA